MPAAISTSMLAEISGIFMNYRNMFSSDNVNSALYFQDDFIPSINLQILVSCNFDFE